MPTPQEMMDKFHGAQGEVDEGKLQQLAEANWAAFYAAFRRLEAEHVKSDGGYTEDELQAWHRARAALEAAYGERMTPHMTDIVEFRP